MAITEENTNPLFEDSLANQLENATKTPAPEYQVQAAGTESVADVTAHQQIDAGWQNAVDLLDDSKNFAGIRPDALQKIKNYNKLFGLVVLGIVIFGALSAAAFFFYRYLAVKSLPNT